MKDSSQNSLFTDYLDKMSERAKESRVYSEHQAIGLDIAKILKDEKNKSLYIKLAKQYGPGKMLMLAKSVAEVRNVKNKGAYFMKVLQAEKIKWKNSK